MCRRDVGALVSLVSLAWAGAALAQSPAAGPPDREVVRIPLDRVPQAWQDRIDPCAIDRDKDGLHAILLLGAQEADGLTVPHERLGSLSEHLRRFLPLHTLRQNDVPSLTRLFDLGAGGRPGGGGGPRGGGTTLQYDRYHTLQEGTSFLSALALAFPNIVQMVSIGQSIEGRSIWALKITDNPTITEPDEERILFTGVTHAREWATHEMMLYLAEYLTHRYPNDPQVRNIVDNSVVWLVPVVNPDGYEYSWNVDRMWRKNRRVIDAVCTGVDINRNYAYGWGGAGSSSAPCSETYRGASPASEPETQAIQGVLANEKPAIAVSFHTYSQLVLYAWGGTADVTPESYSSLRAIGNKYATLVEQVHGRTYLPGQSSYTIYITSGAFDDHAYGAEGALGFTPELRPASWAEGGFLLPEDQILPNNEENMAAALWLMLNAANAVEISNPNSPTLIENPAPGPNMFSLALTPINQHPSAALGLPLLYQDRVQTWLDDAEHNPPYQGLLGVDFEGSGAGSGYILENTLPVMGWAAGLTSYKVLPHVFEDGVEVMLSNVQPGVNLVGIPSDEPIWMQDINIFRRVLAPSGNNFGFEETILEERTALQDLGSAVPWIDWNWRYTDSARVDHFSHPLGAGGADPYVLPFRAYWVTVNVSSSDFGSTANPVFLLRFPGVNRDCNHNGVTDADDISQGTSLDCNANGTPDECEYPGCAGILPGDLDCSGQVDGADLQGFVNVLAGWTYTCSADIDQDGSADLNDVPLFVTLLLAP